MSKQVKIRVAVAVGADSTWVAYGDNRETPEQSRANALVCFDEPAQIYWLEATVDTPSFEDETIQVVPSSEDK